MIKKKLQKLRHMFFCVSIILSLLNVLPTVLGVQGADFAIYNGAGTWEPSKTAFKNFLEWKGLTWEEVSKHDINRGRLIGKYQGLFIPGGWAGNYNKDIRNSGDQYIRDFINQGGAYIGMSAGAFYACDITIWEGDVLNYPSDIFNGDCIGPIEEIAPWPDYVMTTIDINQNHPANIYEPFQRDVLYYGEPYFVPHSGQEMQVFARWNVPSNPTLDNTPGIIGFNYGQGRVMLVGPHPEIDEDDSRDGTNFAEEFSDGPDGSDWSFLWTGVDWLFQQSISLPPGVKPKQCNDGIDNDRDGLTDYPNDLGCTSLLDDDEINPLPTQCNDGIDNDLDNLTDFPSDPGCIDSNDDDETDPLPTQCNDGIDNDGDGLIDVVDPGCVNVNDNDETDLIGPIDVFFDDFENGNLVDWILYGPGSQWIVSTDNPLQGNYSARAKQSGAGDNSFMEITFNAANYSTVSFEYYRKLVGLDTADDFQVEYWNNGWVSLEHLGSSSENNADYIYKSFSIPSTSTKVRFKCECGAVSEKCFVDNVKISKE